MLKFATIIEDRAAADEVGINKSVEVYFIDDDESERYKIVTGIRGDTTAGRVSIESPLGKALLGHKVGDLVHVALPQGGYDLEIRAIEADDSDDEIRSF